MNIHMHMHMHMHMHIHMHRHMRRHRHRHRHMHMHMRMRMHMLGVFGAEIGAELQKRVLGAEPSTKPQKKPRENQYFHKIHQETAPKTIKNQWKINMFAI